MKVTVVVDDNMVLVDGEAYKVDCSDLPSFIHAVQWDGSVGEVEFKADSRGMRQGNMKIVDLAPYKHLVDRWQEAKVIRAAEVEAARKAAEEHAAKIARLSKATSAGRKKRKVQ